MAEQTAEVALDYVPLYVLPDDHPSQAELPEDSRDASIARAAGAEPVEGENHWRLREDADPESGKLLKRKFGTRSAKRRYEKATGNVEERSSWRMNAARAANAEVEARGETPVRAVPEADAPAGERSYFFTAREADSAYHYKKLDEAARDAGIELLIDRDRSSENWGLRYVEGPAPAALDFFRTDEAVSAREASKAAAQASRRQTQDAANTAYTSERRMHGRPLTLPKPDKDPELFERAAKAIESIGTARLGPLVEITRQARDEIRREERRLNAQGQELSPQQKAYFGYLSRGLNLGEKVLERRGKARDSRDQTGGREDAAAPAAGDTGRFKARAPARGKAGEER